MKVALITNKFSTTGGGSDFSLDLIARSLKKMGHDPIVIIGDTKTGQTDIGDTPYRTSVINLSGLSQINKLREITNILYSLEDETDIIHIFTPALIPAGGLYRLSGGKCPVVGRLNGYSLFCTDSHKMSGKCYMNCSMFDKFRHDQNSSLFRLPEYFDRSHTRPKLSNKIDMFFAQSPSVKEIYEQNGFSADKISVVSNFYDPTFREKEFSARTPPQGEISLLYVGRLVENKGVDLLTDAMSHLPSEYSLDIVGAGPLSSQIEIEAEESENIRVHGWVDHEELHSYYQDSSIFVHPGRWPEPSGRVILEARQHNLPMVVSDIGGPPWIAGEACLTFESENTVDLAEKIRKVAEDDQVYTELSAKCSSEIARFDPDNILSELEQKYNEIADKTE
jgi:glycosyltransferase involved in cell wall biosynthesis